jgi:predicted Zn-dependent peptidase
VRRGSDATLAGQLTQLTDTERTFVFVQGVEDKIKALKKSDFDAVLKKYVDLATMSSFVAGDFSKVK